MIGYSILRLPKNTATMKLYRTAYEQEFERDRVAGMRFVERHMKNWEEDTILRLYDMLDYRSDAGFTFFSRFDFPLDKFASFLPPDDIRYVIVQRGFTIAEVPQLASDFDARFELVAERRAEGGDGSGIPTKIYRRRQVTTALVVPYLTRTRRLN